MQADEIEKIAEVFVDLGVNKIRFTGGEPLLRKDFDDIAMRLSKLKCELAISTNGILMDRHIETFKKYGIKKINVSLDTLHEKKFNEITHRNDFRKVISNIDLLEQEGFVPKLNVVVVKGVNEMELIDFILLGKEKTRSVQFIEFMPFHGNKWDLSRTIYSKDILAIASEHFGAENILKLEDAPNDTSRKYRVKGFKGSFGSISTVSNPFCDSCNRIRLTANGRIKNCLFSQGETDLLTAFRNGENIKDLIINTVFQKKKQLGGIGDFESEEARGMVEENRSMILIGG